MITYLDTTSVVFTADEAINLCRQLSMAVNALEMTRQKIDRYPELVALRDQLEHVKTIQLTRKKSTAANLRA